MEEREIFKKTINKKYDIYFAVFTMLVLIFDFLIYKRAERLLYKEIDYRASQISIGIPK